MDREQIENMYPECFNGIGKFKDFEYHITLEDDVQPLKQHARKVALSSQPKIRKELEPLVEKVIITSAEGLTDLVNSLVIREKPDGRLHICLNPKNLNKAIKHEYQ